MLLTTLLPLAGWSEVRLFFSPAETRSRRSQASTKRLVELPIVLCPDPTPLPDGDLQSLVRRRRAELSRLRSPDFLGLRLRACELIVGEECVRLPRSQFYWYVFFASIAGQRFAPAQVATLLTRDSNGRTLITTDKSSSAPTWLPTLVRIHQLLSPKSGDTLAPSLRRACGPHPLLPNIVSKINARLAASLGRGARPYQIATGRRAGYGLLLSADRIRWLDQ